MKRETLEIGVDEAGRGAVLGPLVLAACALSPDVAIRLQEIGVTDSKAFGATARGRARRACLAEEICRQASWTALGVVTPQEVDHEVRRGGLNLLERRVAAQLLAQAPAWDRLVLDGARLFGPLAARYPAATACDRAEMTSVAVAAASLLAKTERDRLFAEFRAQHEVAFGPIEGQGYPNAATARFLDAFFEATGGLPRETRRSWSWTPVARRVPPGEGNVTPAFDFGDV